jgi:hypothetical protein
MPFSGRPRDQKIPHHPAYPAGSARHITLGVQVAILLTIVGGVVGFVSWSFVGILSKGAGPFGPSGGYELLMFLGPFAFLGPCIIRLANRRAWVALTWLAALAPIISVVLNALVFAIAVQIVKAGGNKDVTLGLVVGVGTFLWIAIGVRMVRSGWASGTDPLPCHRPSAPGVARQSGEDLSLIDQSLIGHCPNCREPLRLSVQECWRCDASFAEGSAWKVLANEGRRADRT